MTARRCVERRPRRGVGRVAPLDASLVAVAVVVLDQLTKRWAVNDARRPRHRRLLDAAVQPRVQHAAWRSAAARAGARSSASWRWWSSSCCCCRCAAATSRLADVAVGLIVGGAVGNVIDRLFRGDGWFRGGVVDFIDFQWFPIFNVADMGDHDRWRAAGARRRGSPAAAERSGDAEPTDDEPT